MQNHETVRLNTERLFLRTPIEADAPVLRNVFKDEYATDEAALNHIRWIHNNGYDNRLVVNFTIWLAHADECIGRVYLHAKPEIDGEVEIGYGLSEEYRGHGYATEAAKAVVRYAFEQAGQDVLVAIVKPENSASRRVIEKLGFTRHSVRPVLDDDGVVRDFIYYRLYRDDWQLIGK